MPSSSALGRATRSRAVSKADVLDMARRRIEELEEDAYQLEQKRRELSRRVALMGPVGNSCNGDAKVKEADGADSGVPGSD